MFHQQSHNNHLELIISNAILQWANSSSTELTLPQLCQMVKEKLYPLGTNVLDIDQKVTEMFHRLQTANHTAQHQDTFDCHLSPLISGKVISMAT